MDYYYEKVIFEYYIIYNGFFDNPLYQDFVIDR